MSKLYSFVAFFIAMFTMAQNVSFTDVQFKNILVNATPADTIAKNAAGNWVKIDSNSDGEIQNSEALQIKYLRVPGNGMVTSVVGIKSFAAVDTLYMESLDWIDAIDVSNMTALKKLTAFDNAFITTLNVTGCVALEDLSFSQGNIPALNLSGLPLLKKLYAYGNNISSVNFTGTSALEELDLSNNNLASINLQQFPGLKYVNLGGNSLTTLNASGLAQLEYLNCQSNGLTTVNVQNTPELYLLELNQNFLPSINLTTTPNLQDFKIDQNLLTTIDVSNNPLLSEIWINDNDLTLLDLHTNPNLVFIMASNNNLQTLIIKNGVVDEIYYDWNPNLAYICADDAEIAALVATNISQGLTNTVVNSYCTFTPGGTYYTVTGNTKFDINSNGCETTDPFIALQKFNITSGTATSMVNGNLSGNYAVHLMSGTHTITPMLENPSYFNVTPAALTVDFPTQTSPLAQNFCLTANGSHNDLEAVIFPLNDAVPGYSANYKVVFKNKGNTTQSGVLTLNYDDNVMNFTSATVPPDSQSTGVLTWNFTGLQPFELDEVYVTFLLNTPTATPPLNAGDILPFTVSVAAGADVTPADNIFALNEIVVNSFDPNDKTCLEGTTIAQTKVGDYVHYLIRFENNGTANAQNIVVKDVIDTAKFDINSLIVMDASHNFVTNVTSPNIVEFIFENIQLPFANATNDGYVMFKIKTVATLALGDTFSNTANIYFDYNAPIITNTFTTTVQNALSTVETVQNGSDIVIYPNPVKDILYFRTDQKVTKAEIFDGAGRKVASFGVKENQIDIAALKSGLYMIRIFTKDGVSVKKVIKK